jgi:serine/threonine-protein kinase RsbW
VRVRVETIANATLVIAEGRLDFNAAGHFESDLERALAASAGTAAAVIVDCVAVDYVSSAGLRTFLKAARAAQRAGISFAVSGLQPAVREVFELSGFNRMIAVHADSATALAHAAAGRLGEERRIGVASDAAQLPVLTRFLKEYWLAAALPAEQATPCELALEEIFMNVVLHGAPAGAARVEVSLRLEERTVTMTISDDAPAFDPLSLPAPHVTASLGERRIGGQGVYLVRKMMDTVAYRREGALNVLTMTRKIAR